MSSKGVDAIRESDSHDPIHSAQTQGVSVPYQGRNGLIDTVLSPRTGPEKEEGVEMKATNLCMARHMCFVSGSRKLDLLLMTTLSLSLSPSRLSLVGLSFVCQSPRDLK